MSLNRELCKTVKKGDLIAHQKADKNLCCKFKGHKSILKVLARFKDGPLIRERFYCKFF